MNNPSNEILNEKPSWLRRHKTKAGIAAFALSGAVFLSQPENILHTKDEIKDNADLAYKIFPLTEGAAFLGAGMMLASAGKRVGNPLTIKKRLSEVKHELNDKRLYRAGWAVGAIGAVGTSATVSVGAVYSLPASTWPVAFGISAASLGFSTIPFKPSPSDQETQKGGE